MIIKFSYAGRSSQILKGTPKRCQDSFYGFDLNQSKITLIELLRGIWTLNSIPNYQTATQEQEKSMFIMPEVTSKLRIREAPAVLVTLDLCRRILKVVSHKPLTFSSSSYWACSSCSRSVTWRRYLLLTSVWISKSRNWKYRTSTNKPFWAVEHLECSTHPGVHVFVSEQSLRQHVPVIRKNVWLCARGYYSAINTVIIYVSGDWSVKRAAWVTFCVQYLTCSPFSWDMNRQLNILCFFFFFFLL